MQLQDLKVLYEDNHLIAVNKPAGVLVQSDETGDTPLYDVVREYIRIRYEKPGEAFLGNIHRIDRPVSGVVIFARTSKALVRMNKLFEQKEVEKTYWAITPNRPEPLQASLEHFLVKDTQKNITKAYDYNNTLRSKDGKLGKLSYRLIAGIGNHHLLEVKPLTGRPHQIRAQLAKIGCPIKNDLKYGYTGAKGNENLIYLHARRLSFIHPITLQPVVIEADLPKDPMWNQFRNIDDRA
jgi:23S rRNA pseudouridine1911/1915/1917 synthase